MTFLWAAFGKQAPSQTKVPFSDVAPDCYNYNAVLWAVENGITAGVGNDRCGVGQVCTRANVVTFLYKACAD